MTIGILAAVAVTYLISYTLYSLNRGDSARRSRLLQQMIICSLFSWLYLGTGLLLCTLLLEQYEAFPDLTIREVLAGSLLASFAFATIMALVGRRFAFSKTLERMKAPLGLHSIASDFAILSWKMGVRGVSLAEANLKGALSISLGGRGVVAVSSDLAGALSPVELEAVLAHELSHIKNRDSEAKSLAKLARVAFPFDPVLRLVEAAVHREREFWADRRSVEYTRKPLALASALVKANSLVEEGTELNMACSFVGGGGRGLFSPYPNLERRVDVLLDIARRMKLDLNSPIDA